MGPTKCRSVPKRMRGFNLPCNHTAGAGRTDLDFRYDFILTCICIATVDHADYIRFGPLQCSDGSPQYPLSTPTCIAGRRRRVRERTRVRWGGRGHTNKDGRNQLSSLCVFRKGQDLVRGLRVERCSWHVGCERIRRQRISIAI